MVDLIARFRSDEGWSFDGDAVLIGDGADLAFTGVDPRAAPQRGLDV